MNLPSVPVSCPSQRLLEAIRSSIREDTFVRIVVSHAESEEGEPRGVRQNIRWVKLKQGWMFSITERRSGREQARSLSRDEFDAWMLEQLERPCKSALLCTTAGDWQWVRGAKGEPPRLITHPASIRASANRAHDHRKPFSGDASSAHWMKALGILDSAGALRASMASKHRQIARYVELLEHHLSPVLERADPLRVVDAGAGKGYLTFAVWHWLKQSGRLRDFRVCGWEMREDLVKQANQVATSIGATELSFKHGLVASAEIGQGDVLIALHACNTATDDALLLGVQAGAAAILLSPCCHQALRPEMSDPAPFANVLRHGIFKERMAEWTTDALRLLALEAAGYQTTAIEFVDAGHSPRNLLLVGIRKQEGVSSSSAADAYKRLKDFFGIECYRLDTIVRSAPDPRHGPA
ncbi:MAG: SAM-dependent methyltransferase [Verrucomicrobia bacterium]|nr:SAM-dependent methyltransferase [Verrucomicrobiota bacterium]